MDSTLQWPPIVWTARIVLLLVLAGAGYVFLLFLIRFLNLRNIKGMALVALPRVESLGGEFGGARAEVRLVAQDRQLSSIEKRLMDLEEGHAWLVSAVKQIRKEAKQGRKKG